MTKLITIVQREYMYYLRKKSFLFTAFGIPLLIMVVLAISIVLIAGEDETIDLSGETHYGYVDLSGNNVIPVGIAEDYHNYLFVGYADEAEARAALDDEVIPAYIVITEDYMKSGEVQLFSYEGVPDDLFYYIDELLVTGISSTLGNDDLPVARFIDPVNPTVRLEDSGRELTPTAFIPLVVLPIAFAVVFMMASQITGSFLMAGLIEEKNNRIMEIMVTSVTPMQLLAGKIIGLGALGLTQLAAWIAGALVIFTIGGQLDFLEGVTFPVDLSIIAVLYFLLGYSLIASLMAGIGAVVGSEQESRQYAGMFSIVFAVPYFFIVSFVTNPNGAIPVGLSLFPFTAPMAMVMRSGLAGVPTWQIALSTLILVLTIGLFVWSSAKLFRWGLLLYGKKAGLRDLIMVLRGNVDPGTLTTRAKGNGKKGKTA